MSDHDNYADTGPPKAPPFDRRVQIPRGHALGLLLLASLPLLAAFGVFGGSERTHAAEGGGVALAVSYAPRLRYGHPMQLKIEVRSTGGETLSGMRVRVEESFLDRFDHITPTPEPRRRSAQACEFLIDDDVRDAVFALDLDPGKYGTARGKVAVVAADNRVAVELPLQAFILP